MQFSEFSLHSNIYKAIDVCGYLHPTPIQAKTIPLILEGKDVVACAQTGTGKTAAFVLPALHLIDKPSKKPSILILTPTRELAKQINQAIHRYGKFIKLKNVNVVGGEKYLPQIKALSQGADIIVATPGRLLDHVNQGRVDLSEIKMLVLDEADRMLDMGFTDDVEKIASLTPRNRQTLLFSATLDPKLKVIVRHLLKNPEHIDLSHEKIDAPKITQEIVKVKNTQYKSRFLKQYLNDETIYKAIIFSATKRNADHLAMQLRDLGFKAAALHGDLRQNIRNRTIEQFGRGAIQYLVATDLAARGIDIRGITHVINYDLPRFCEDYVHRIGRTGRAGNTGKAISLILPTDIKHLQRIERYIGQRLKLIQYTVSNEPLMTDRSSKNNEHEESIDDYDGQRRHHKRNDHDDQRRYSKKNDDSDGKRRYSKKNDNDDQRRYRKKYDNEDDQRRYSKKNDDSDGKRRYHKRNDDYDNQRRHHKQNDDHDGQRRYSKKNDNDDQRRHYKRNDNDDDQRRRHKPNDDHDGQRRYSKKNDNDDQRRHYKRNDNDDDQRIHHKKHSYKTNKWNKEDGSHNVTDERKEYKKSYKSSSKKKDYSFEERKDKTHHFKNKHDSRLVNNKNKVYKRDKFKKEERDR